MILPHPSSPPSVSVHHRTSSLAATIRGTRIDLVSSIGNTWFEGNTWKTLHISNSNRRLRRHHAGGHVLTGAADEYYYITLNHNYVSVPPRTLYEGIKNSHHRQIQVLWNNYTGPGTSVCSCTYINHGAWRLQLSNEDKWSYIRSTMTTTILSLTTMTVSNYHFFVLFSVINDQTWVINTTKVIHTSGSPPQSGDRLLIGVTISTEVLCEGGNSNSCIGVNSPSLLEIGHDRPLIWGFRKRKK